MIISAKQNSFRRRVFKGKPEQRCAIVRKGRVPKYPPPTTREPEVTSMPALKTHCDIVLLSNSIRFERSVDCGKNSDRMAEWSKALRSGRSIFGYVGSNPTPVNLTLFRFRNFSENRCLCGRKHMSSTKARNDEQESLPIRKCDTFINDLAEKGKDRFDH